MSFSGARVLCFESRRAKEIAELVRLQNGEPFVAPALIEVPLEHNEEAFQFAERLFRGEFDIVIFLTGVGAKLLHRVLNTRYPEERFPEALRKIIVVARGPKPMAVMRELQVPVTVSVPEPNTWREILSAVESYPGTTVAVQEYGRRSQELLDGLSAQGRTVTTVPVYQWQLPPDIGPLKESVQKLVRKEADVVLFTTSVQIIHLLQVAAQESQEQQVLDALRQTYVASIGPTCTETLLEHGISPALEPSHPKMGILVREAALDYAKKEIFG